MVLKDRISINSGNFWVKHYVLFCVLILFYNFKNALSSFLKNPIGQPRLCSETLSEIKQYLEAFFWLCDLAKYTLDFSFLICKLKIQVYVDQLL